MSSYSQFSDFGSVGGFDYGVPVIRSTSFLGTLTYDFNAGQSGCWEISDTPSFAVGFADPYANTAASPLLISRYDFNTKIGKLFKLPKTYAISNPVRPILANPITKGILMQNPGVDSTGATVYRSDNYSTWTSIGVSAIAAPILITQGDFGGWFDGTNFAFPSQVSAYYTSDGVNYTDTGLGNQSQYVFFPGNNRSAYSGYFFAYINTPSQGYTYRTTVNGSTTQVLGYQLVAMSRNGRYIARTLLSNNQLQYSTDGGASWSVFTNQGPFGAGGGVGQANPVVAGDNGEFFIVGSNGQVFGYKFATNEWLLVALLPDAVNFGSTGITAPQKAIGTNQVLCHLATNTPRRYLVADFPKNQW